MIVARRQRDFALAQLSAHRDTPMEPYWRGSVERNERRMIAAAKAERPAIRPRQRECRPGTARPRSRSRRTRRATRAGPDPGDPDPPGVAPAPGGLREGAT